MVSVWLDTSGLAVGVPLRVGVTVGVRVGVGVAVRVGVVPGGQVGVICRPLDADAVSCVPPVSIVVLAVLPTAPANPDWAETAPASVTTAV